MAYSKEEDERVLKVINNLKSRISSLGLTMFDFDPDLGVDYNALAVEKEALERVLQMVLDTWDLNLKIETEWEAPSSVTGIKYNFKQYKNRIGERSVVCVPSDLEFWSANKAIQYVDESPKYVGNFNCKGENVSP